MLRIESGRDHTRAKAARRVQRATSELHADHLSNEESQTDADGCHESRPVLLCRKHVDRKDQLGREKCLDEDALCDVGTAAQGGSNVEILGKQESYEHRGHNTAKNLGDEQSDGAEDRDSTDEHQGERHGRVEEATADAEEDLYHCQSPEHVIEAER